MHSHSLPVAAFALVTVLLAACGSGSKSTPPAGLTNTPPPQPVTLTIFAAGTLANPFNAIDQAFMSKYPNVTIQAQFGGSVKEVKQVTDLGMKADVVGVADYSVIDKYMSGAGGKTRYADWYVGFASNAITFVYTSQSKGASQITPDNWYTILSQPGVRIGRSNPDTDPSGYQTLQMLALAEKYYKQPGLSDAILKNAPTTFIRDTETELIGALQAGEIDYLAIYKSDALQHKFSFIDLPPQINLSNPSYAGEYTTASVNTANGPLQGLPIIYAVTIPTNATHADWAEKWAEFLLGPEGQKVLKDDGFQVLTPALVHGSGAPAILSSLTKVWPAQ